MNCFPVNNHQIWIHHSLPYFHHHSLYSLLSHVQATPKSTGDSADDEDDHEHKEDFRCRWKECGILLENQSLLVQHVNVEHIQRNKKDCTCYWDDCSREERPFKAMYMLVVHVRRHTGEKPHKCHVSNIISLRNSSLSLQTADFCYIMMYNNVSPLWELFVFFRYLHPTKMMLFYFR